MPKLIRLISTPLFTKGILTYDNDVLCHTLELPWRDNQRNLSCIPSGVYLAHKSNSTTHGPCLRLPSVLNRTGILIHTGNTIQDTRGCILVGLDTNSNGVINSKQALYRILQQLPSDFQLEIRSI